MEWNDLEKEWQACFKLSWESFKKGSIPIGSVITNEIGEIVSKGRSLQYEMSGDPGEIAHHKISHAELNAIIKVSEFDHPNIRKYTLFTTTEPCPLCFGALVMANIRFLKYAARDRFAGSAELNNASEYIKSKKINVLGPFTELEKVQITLHTAYELKRNYNCERLLEAWRMDCPNSVDLGIKLSRDNTLQKFIDTDVNFSEIFNFISNMLDF